jgi:hypothetical protein
MSIVIWIDSTNTSSTNALSTYSTNPISVDGIKITWLV